MPLPQDQVKRIASLELNALQFSGVLTEALEGTTIASVGTPIFDLNGTQLYRRVPLARGRQRIGYADVGVHEEAWAEPLLAVSTGVDWNEKAILEEATAAARKGRRSLKFDRTRFVAYSYPKIAIQFLREGQEVLMLEWKTWAEVPPPSRRRREQSEPSNFQRWSFVDRLPPRKKAANARNFQRRLHTWETRAWRRFNSVVIAKRAFDLSGIVLRVSDTREIHYSRPVDHHPCYELRGQQTNVWCVAASVEMLLNFYRYSYDQPRLAQEMGLGTCANPSGLPYGQESKVVTTIEKLSSSTLDATAIANPGWATFRNEIRANRPLISFIPGHSRTVAGYTQSLISFLSPFRGLLVYDPWPPTDCSHPDAGGVITRWENFANQTYRYAFTAVLDHV